MTSIVYWIDADKELPDSDTSVLIYCQVADDPVWLGYYFDGQWWEDSGINLPVHGVRVTHWAHLPDPPKIRSWVGSVLQPIT